MDTKIKGEKGRSSSRCRISALDRDLWALATRDVVRLTPETTATEGDGAPLQEPQTEHPSTRSQGKTVFQTLDSGYHLPVRMKENEPLPPSSPPRTDGRTAGRLRRGKISIQARIDLHGHTRAQAQMALTRFLMECHDRDFRCVLVITGKGRRAHDGTEGILRRHFPEWVASAPLHKIVLAVHPAKARDGGSGAFYVLLRRKP